MGEVFGKLGYSDDEHLKYTLLDSPKCLIFYLVVDKAGKILPLLFLRTTLAPQRPKIIHASNHNVNVFAVEFFVPFLVPALAYFSYRLASKKKRRSNPGLASCH